MKRLALNLAVVVFVALLVGRAARAADYVWIEGEQPTRQNFDVAGVGWGNQQYLSQEKWINVSIPPDQMEARIPEAGIIFSYDFQAPSAGGYEVWNRIGFEFVRSPFDWRLDDGQWQTITPDQLTTDLMEISNWCEVAWLKMGDAQLSAGKHTLEVRLPRAYTEQDDKKQPQKTLYAGDALCLYKGAFRPNGKFRPDEDWQGPQDRQAAAQVFQVSANAAEGERLVTPLSGLWQIARYDEQDVQDRLGPIAALPPADQLYWKAISVPGDRNAERPELIFNHRYFLRTRIDVPADLKGRSFFLHFTSTNMIATVFVNGAQCGWNKTPFALWDCDITGALKPGQVNDLWVGFKDTYYATATETRRSFNMPAALMDGNQGVTMKFDMPVWNHRENGILEPPALVATGPAYTADVFAMPSVQKKELGLEVTVKNASAAPLEVSVENSVVPLDGGPAAKTFQPKGISIPAGGEQTLTLTEKWQDPKLWWPDDPQQYNVVTRLTAGGKTLDTRLTKFGFREWTWDGPQFKLNGVPFQGRADGTGASTPEETVALWRKEGATMVRFWGTSWHGMTMSGTLDFMDKSGVPVRRSGIFDGEGANYGLTERVEQDGKTVTVPRQALFDNWREQVTAMVRGERNHPSVFVWSIENEIMYINSINFGTPQITTPAISAVAKAVMAVDPTRPAMIDGGRALPDFSLPVNGCHYNDPSWRDLPDVAYSMDFLTKVHYHEPWDLRPDAPVFLGEAYFVNGSKASAYSMVGGEQAFLGRTEAREGVGLIARMMSEGYRWMGLAAFEFLIGNPNSSGNYYVAWQPVAVLCRQWDWSFGAGSEVKRTLKVFNDTHHPDPITMGWQLVVDGKAAAGERKAFDIAPGLAQETEVSFEVPQVADNTPAQFILTCERGGKEVFRDVKDVHIIDTAKDARPDLKPGELLVWDREGGAKARLEARGIPFKEFTGLDNLPDGARVIVVGPDTLSGRDATDARWKDLAGSGARIIVLDQAEPLHFQAVPANLEPGNLSGHVAFAEDLTHPAFAGLGQADFFTWSGDGLVYRNAYRKASSGAKSLAQCDDDLGYSALSEVAVGTGLMLLSQFDTGGKLGADPVADRLFDNLLAYAASYRLVQKQTASAVKEGSPLDVLLSDINLKYDRVSDVVGAISDGRHQILIAEADPATLKTLAGSLDKVRAFTRGGGWLMLFGVTPEGLADYNTLVGYQHLLRPFEMERVTLPAVRDPLLSGLTTRDVVMESGQRIYAWAGDRYMSNDVFTDILDIDDIAPFCTFPGPQYWNDPDGQPGNDTWPRNMVNGFLEQDSWRYCFSIHLDKGDPTQWDLKLPRQEEVIGFSIDPNTIYHHITQIRLTFDGDKASAVTLDLQSGDGRQDFSFPPHKCSVLNIDLAKWDAVGSANVIGVDNLWIRVKRPEGFYDRVKPLLNIGGMVKYPMGTGGIVTNQLRILATESVPVNADKKRTIVGALLRNLNATFAAGPQELAPGEALRYTPVALEDKCNRFLTGPEALFRNALPRDLAALPRGKSRFAGVDYVVREFQTSPLPSVIVLNGSGAAGVQTLPMQVGGIPVSRKVDAIFFLHAYNQYAQPDARRERNPVVFQYVIHYEDGQTAAVPVRLGLEVAHWVSKDPAGLREAALAWAAPFPNDTSGDQAALYQMQWNNPRPDVAVQSVDVTYGETGNRYGQPAVVAITAANAVQ